MIKSYINISPATCSFITTCLPR